MFVVAVDDEYFASSQGDGNAVLVSDAAVQGRGVVIGDVAVGQRAGFTAFVVQGRVDVGQVVQGHRRGVNQQVKYITIQIFITRFIRNTRHVSYTLIIN